MQDKTKVCAYRYTLENIKNQGGFYGYDVSDEDAKQIISTLQKYSDNEIRITDNMVLKEIKKQCNN